MTSPGTLKNRLGIIDLGSNSARLIVADYTPGVAFRIADEFTRRVRLSEGMATDDVLRPAAMARALATLKAFRAFCETHGVKRIIPVATAAVRNAVNGAEFLGRVRAETGLKFRVLTGDEEAQLGVIAIVNSIGMRDGLMLDIGGGSVEVSQVAKARIKRVASVPLGAVRLTELFLRHDPVRSTEAARLRDHIAALFAPLGWMKAGPGGKISGVGGTIRALARIDGAARQYPLSLINGYELQLTRLEELIRRLRELPIEDRVRAVPGLSPDRADIILAGAMVLAGALRRAGADRSVLCSQGVRDGLFYQEFLKPAGLPVIRDLRRLSVLNMGRVYGFDEVHANHVARLALSLFDGLSDRHGCGAADRECLWAAAHLSEIGRIVEYYDYRKHSAYLILNAGLPGYSHRETALIALLCEHERKDKAALSPYATLFEPGDVERISRMGTILRLAEYLDRSRTQAVKGARIQVKNGRARLLLQARDSVDASVEPWEFRRYADLFEEAFGCKLEVTGGV